MWVWFKKLLLQCSTHRLPNNVTLQYFYHSLDSVNKGVADQLVQSGIMLQSFELLQKQVLEKVDKPKETRGVFRAEEGSFSGYLKLGENEGWNFHRVDESFYPSYLGENNTLPLIIAADLLEWQTKVLLEVLRRYIKAIRCTIADIVGIPPGICNHKIQLDSEYSKWVSPVQCVPKNGGITIVPNEKRELVSMRPVTEWRVCMDYRKLNSWTEKDHFPMPFMDQMLDRLSEREWYCFLDGSSGYNQISIAMEEQDKTTFTCPYGNFSFKRMPFRLCNPPTMF
ncbi:uncharacterized protein [Solanum tuberosum]|uniref:uncharacterized protein n=1 Tax=Solanum tuberosum TaxID=4113 RepID=UPI00073A084A|nr:PREDICTED: uncharacterized protein LOC107061441 [Solanum tuberosum]